MGLPDSRPGAKQKKYRRHPKPPYTYLAMIALVIRAAPGRRLKLSQIIKEISALFPFFKGGYQGWKDSVRHNLSSNDCFSMLLKDPGRPKAKGNFWTVDTTRIPPEALKLQNTPISRQEEATFPRDLAPYVLQGHPYRPANRAPPGAQPVPARGGAEDSKPPRSKSFTIEAMLPDLHRMDSNAEPGRGATESSLCPLTSVPNSQGHSPRTGSSSLSGGGSSVPHSPTSAPQLLRTCHSGACCISPGSVVCQFPIMTWGQLPAPYAANMASNMVAPFSLPPLFAFPPPPSLPRCPYSPTAYMDSAYWNMVAVPCSMPLSGHPLGPQSALPVSKDIHAPSLAAPPWGPLPASTALLNTGFLHGTTDAAGPPIQPPWQLCLSQPLCHPPNDSTFAGTMLH